MTRWQQTLEVARWEFNRFVKWRQQLIGLALMLVVGFAAGFIGGAVKKSKSKPVRVAAIGAEVLGFALPDTPPVVWDAAQAWTEASARAAVTDETLGGALIVRSATDAELVIRRRAGWTEPLERALNAARQQATMAGLITSPEDLARVMTPMRIATTIVQGGVTPVAKSTKIATAAILGFGLTILLTGFGTIFVGITGEKTHRVTEQMMAMGRPSISLPPIASDFGMLALILLITLLGVAMWFSFMAALAATIDDPNSSTRSLLLFVPMLPMGLAFALLDKADSTAALVFSIFPLTSMAVLPLRLVMTSVAWWEVALSLAVLLGAVFVFRTAAGKVFATAMLMHGKEPTPREIWRWVRASP